jgi:hypothetical protein
MTVTGFDGYLDPLDEAECRRLLAAQTVARIGFSHEGSILVLPVAIVTEGDVVVFTTSPESVLAVLAAGAEVAVQVDDYDPGFLDGWSVLAQGRTFPYEGGARPEAWASGHEDVVVGVRIGSITGRAIAAPMSLGEL